MVFGLTEEAQVKLEAGENHVFADKALANKRKMVKCVQHESLFSFLMGKYLSILIV